MDEKSSAHILSTDKRDFEELRKIAGASPVPTRSQILNIIALTSNNLGSLQNSTQSYTSVTTSNTTNVTSNITKSQASGVTYNNVSFLPNVVTMSPRKKFLSNNRDAALVEEEKLLMNGSRLDQNGT